MSGPIELTGLTGSNPAAFMAALGVLDVATRALPEDDVRLWWQGRLLPKAVIDGPDSVDHLIDLVLADRDRWRESVVFTGFDGANPTDVKADPDDVRPWFEAAAESDHPEDLRLLHGLISEGAVAGKGDSKPTHLHFTAGQMKFLSIAAQARDGIDSERVREALIGPWKYGSKLGVLRWDNERGERLHALSAKSPTSTKSLGVPAVDWLAFLGLQFFPTVTDGAGLLTAACLRAWKSGGEMHWGVWGEPAGAAEVAVLLRQSAKDQDRWSELGMSGRFKAEIRRTDQGGYGSFGPTVRR